VCGASRDSQHKGALDRSLEGACHSARQSNSYEKYAARGECDSKFYPTVIISINKGAPVRLLAWLRFRSLGARSTAACVGSVSGLLDCQQAYLPTLAKGEVALLLASSARMASMVSL